MPAGFGRADGWLRVVVFCWIAHLDTGTDLWYGGIVLGETRGLAGRL